MYSRAANNDTTMDLSQNKFYNSIFNEGQDRNPAFFDFAKCKDTFGVFVNNIYIFNVSLCSLLHI